MSLQRTSIYIRALILSENNKKDVEQEANIVDNDCRDSVSICQVKYHVYDSAGIFLGTRKQLPVLPGYAITIHRSQGMIISNLRIDFKGFSEWKPNGAAYVALSRCNSLKGLNVSSLEPEMISVSPKAVSLFIHLRRLSFVSPTRLWGLFPCTNTIEQHGYKRKSSSTVETSEDPSDSATHPSLKKQRSLL